MLVGIGGEPHLFLANLVCLSWSFFPPLSGHILTLSWPLSSFSMVFLALSWPFLGFLDLLFASSWTYFGPGASSLAFFCAFLGFVLFFCALLGFILALARMQTREALAFVVPPLSGYRICLSFFGK